MKLYADPDPEIEEVDSIDILLIYAMLLTACVYVLLYRFVQLFPGEPVVPHPSELLGGNA